VLATDFYACDKTFSIMYKSNCHKVTVADCEIAALRVGSWVSWSPLSHAKYFYLLLFYEQTSEEIPFGDIFLDNLSCHCVALMCI